MKPHKLPAETRPHFSASSVCTAFLILASRSALRSSSVAPASRAFSLSSNSLRRLALISEPLSPCYILHDEAPPYSHSSAYSPNLLKGRSSRKFAYSLLHRRSSGGQEVGSNNGPGIESRPCAAFHLATYSSSSSIRERGSPSSV